MRNSNGRDPVAWVAIGITLLANLAGLAWIAGRFDARVSAAERDITELKLKFTKDGEQDVKIAIISTQLANISAQIGEVNGKLGAGK